MKNRWLKIAAACAVWAFLGLVLSLELFFNSRAEGMWTGSFLDIALPQFCRAAMWGGIAPFILMLRERVPLNSGRWAGGIVFHIAFSFIVMATYYLGRMGANHLLNDGSPPFWRAAYEGFYGHNLVDMAYYWAVLAFGYGIELQRRYKSEELRAVELESRLIQAELHALREQLKPHFLFNTLNTIAVLIREGKNDLAVTLLARLGSLLRMSLDGNRENETPLRAEMEFLSRYVDIQKARFPDRLTVDVAVDEAALGATVPSMILQPIVENAILHGIAPKLGPGRVEILGRVEGGRLRLEVRDDGQGMPAGRPFAEGTGLRNTRERLAKLYGDAARLTVRERPAGGTAVEIVLPRRT